MSKISYEEKVQAIPFLDEIIMYASFIKKICSFNNAVEWITEHKILSVIIGIVITLVLLIFIFM